MSWENFTRDEFECKCGCRQNEIRDELINVLQEIRTAAGVPMPISSGYRCKHHPVEAAKSKPGTHQLGLAADIAVSRAAAFKINKAAAQNEKVTALGWSQKGNTRFIHIDIVEDSLQFPRPTCWSY